MPLQEPKHIESTAMYYHIELLLMEAYHINRVRSCKMPSHLEHNLDVFTVSIKTVCIGQK